MVMIVNKCRRLGLGEGGFYQPRFRDGASLHLEMMCLGKNWDCEACRYGETRPVDGSFPPQIPAEFSHLVRKAIEESQSLMASKKLKVDDGIPFMSPDICIVNFYTTTGRLGLHQASAQFHKAQRTKREDEKAEKVALESGDVLLYGGRSRNVIHGVRSILKDTAPKVLVQETNLRPGRLNLTLRQC
ncbi:hypothetical protein AALP_AA3G158400 [Arabis alpina]|uniref:Alpha-ketoglutarate-dependent dioxygenase AlkB-like domain-containing protein n=1 Tax=Arabis alpina TaxID=50452 RepID=A0A087H9H0_ARAAL|nr:hypothetical protein AALP_AA3G158400 [Arabis alpina]